MTEDWDTIHSELKRKNLGRGTISSYKNGFWILRYLHRYSHRRPEDSFQFYYSPVTQLELLCGSLRGQAIRRAANSGVPNRWYIRVNNREVRLHLEPDGYAQVKSDQEEVKREFEAVEIELTEQPVGPEVWEVAQRLLENIFLDVQDCLVYASAFLLQANELITTDVDLGSVVGYVYNPGSATPELVERFEAVRSALVDWQVRMDEWRRDDIILPEHRTIKQMIQFVGGDTV